MDVSGDVVIELANRLLDVRLPIERRFRALFSLRNLRGDGPRNALIEALSDKSCLLAHEAAFALGQMQDLEAIPALRAALKNLNYHPMVRHEAAEALGAIGAPDCVSMLLESLNDPAQEVRETCQLAISRIEQSKNTRTASQSSLIESGCPSAQSPFLSVDPAIAAPSDLSVKQLRDLLLDDSADMYSRYGALFALRNLQSSESAQAIIAALHASSALLRHEVAYVLGQLQDQAASEALMDVLAREDENPMVRHEAAEALGAIADRKSIELLQRFKIDPEPIVAESCDVALDMLQFELQEGSFQYADVGVGQ